MRTHEQKPFFSASSQRALMLHVQTKTESRWALSYAYLLAVHHDPTGSIELRFSFGSVVIEGHGLSDLYHGLAQQTVTFIREADPEKDLTEHGKAIVRKISICVGE